MEFASHCNIPRTNAYLTNITIFPVIGKDDKIIKLMVSVNRKLISFKFTDLDSVDQYQYACVI